ncbi:MAG: hypothetical protein WDN66_04950 [Candidatus Saccharibacteria bacterium]
MILKKKGFVLKSVQGYLNRLEQGTPAEIRSAAMLRGAFNELFEKIEEQ